VDRDLRLRNGRPREQAIVRAALSRRAPVALALVLLPALLVACGKGGATTTIVRTTGAAQSGGGHGGTEAEAEGNGKGGGSPSEGGGQGGSSPSLAHARAYARAVNLTPTDVPGFTPTVEHQKSSASQKRFERQMLSCAGLTGQTKGVYEESSKSFELKHDVIDLSVSSEVSIAASAADAQRALGAIRSAHVRECFSQFLQKVFQNERIKGATVGHVSIQTGTPPAPGTSGGFGWRVTADFDVHGIAVPVYLDILGFVIGPSQVTLTSTGILRPFPAEAEQHLFTLLLARARAHRP
jgi:hypothetical protein